MSHAQTYMLPHLVTKHDVTKALLNHLAGGDYTQIELIDEAELLSCRQFHAPVYNFWGQYVAEYSAAVGFDRTEYYQDTERVYEDGEYRDKRVTRANHVTDWHPVSGSHSGDFQFHTYCGPDLPAEARALVEAVADFSTFKSVAKGQTARMDIDQPHCGVEASFQKCSGQLDNIIGDGIHAKLPGDRIRDTNWSYRVSRNDMLALIPLFHVTYKYKENIYQFWADGRDITRTCGDPLPVDKSLKIETTLATLPGIIFTIVILVAFYRYYDYLTTIKVSICIFLMFASWLYSGFKINKLIDTSKAARQQKLARRLAALNLETSGADGARAQDALPTALPEQNPARSSGAAPVSLAKMPERPEAANAAALHAPAEADAAGQPRAVQARKSGKFKRRAAA